FIAADTMFHRLLINASGFMHIVQITEQVSGQLDRIRYLSVAEPIRAAAAIQEHRTLIKHLQDGDAAACEQMVRQHLQESWVLIRELLDR
ncbi:MAG: FCD domain-containing protein, partial [Rhodospirillales bacterium]